MDRAQVATHTTLLRHANLLAAAKAYLATTGRAEAELKLLSFGCSIGDEVASLKLAMPQAAVFGCDVNELALASAQATTGGLGEIFMAGEAALRERAPFDAIFALSTLCVHPPPPGPFSLSLPFDRFGRIVATLAELLSPDGVLVLYNASYLFTRTAAAAAFTPVLSDAVCRNGFVSIYDESGEVMVRYATSPTGMSVRRLVRPQSLSDNDLVDCLFAKRPKGDGPLTVRLHDADWAAKSGWRPAFDWERSELDGFAPAERAAYIDMRRRYRAFVGPTPGDLRYEYDVCRLSLDGARELKLATYGPLQVLACDGL